MEKKIPRVLIISPQSFFKENLDGVSKVNYHLAKNQKGYRTSFTFYSPPSNEHPLPSHFTPSQYIPFPGAKVWEVERWRKLLWPITMAPFNSLSPDLTEFARFIKRKEDQFDIFHISTLALAKLLDYFPESLRKKCVLAPIDSLSYLYSQRVKSEQNLILKWVWRIESIKARLYEKKYYSLVPKVLFVSGKDLKYVENFLPGKGSVVPNGVGEEFFKAAYFGEKDTDLIFVGNFNYRPNLEGAHFIIDQLVPALKRSNFLPKIRLVGGNPSEKMRVCPDVETTGFVDDLPRELSKARLFISPIFFGAGMKNKVLEAMACGLSVFGTKRSFDGIDCRDQLTVPEEKENDPDWWAQEIKSILTNKNFTVNTTENIRELSNKYSWEKIRGLYGENYRELN